MAYSGTVSTTTFDTVALIDDAFRMAGVPPQGVTDEMQDTARQSLYLLLSSTSNRGIPLWAIDKQVLGLKQAQSTVTTPIGTIDVLNVNLRTLTQYTGTESARLGGILTDFGSGEAQTISSVGVKTTASPTYSLIFETSDDGVTFTTVGTSGSTAFTAGDWTWFDIDPALPARYFCIRDQAATTLVLTASYLGGNPTEIPFGRLNKDDYVSLPNKTFQGRPLQYWLDRQVGAPVLRLWPTPDAANETSQVVVWRHRHIMDVGTLAQSIEVPQRWLEAISMQLAIRLILREPKADKNQLAVLKPMADEALMMAWAEERDQSPFRMTKAIDCYTA